MSKGSGYIPYHEAVAKAEHYCAYQERCHSEVREKLFSIQAHPAEMDEIILHLIRNNFLNEERFAMAFARGKFRALQWGRIKIRLELKRRKISDTLIRQALASIEDEEYEATLKNLLEKKLRSIKGIGWQRARKAAAYASGKGFEPEMALSMANRLCGSEE